MKTSQTKTLSLQAAYEFGISHNLPGEIEEIKNMVIEWDRSYTSTLRRGYIVELFEQNGIFEEFKEKYWALGNTRSGETQKKRFLRIKREYEDFLNGIGEFIEEEDDYDEREFAAESDLRDFLAKNLEIIEPGLMLYTDGDRNGVEYAIEKGRIDVLAVDKDGKYVVVELKVSAGRQKVLGQILYYMAFVDEHFGNKPCRGVIIAKEIPDELILAARRIEGLQLFRYNLSVTLERVQ